MSLNDVLTTPELVPCQLLQEAIFFIRISLLIYPVEKNKFRKLSAGNSDSNLIFMPAFSAV